MRVLLSLGLVLALSAGAVAGEVLFEERFNDLDNWRPLYFPKIKEHSRYSIVKGKNGSYLKTESNGSASAIIYKHKFDVYRYPRASWEWKAENVYRRGNAREKKGDDYPVRVYVVFELEPEKAGFLERLKYKALALLYGQEVPHSSLNYIWANKTHRESVITSPYTERAKMLPLRQGEMYLGQWVREGVDILDDYRKAFGVSPPSRAKIALMNDSDNTGERAVSYVRFIKVSGR